MSTQSFDVIQPQSHSPPSTQSNNPESIDTDISNRSRHSSSSSYPSHHPSTSLVRYYALYTDPVQLEYPVSLHKLESSQMPLLHALRKAVGIFAGMNIKEISTLRYNNTADAVQREMDRAAETQDSSPVSILSSFCDKKGVNVSPEFFQGPCEATKVRDSLRSPVYFQEVENNENKKVEGEGEVGDEEDENEDENEDEDEAKLRRRLHIKKRAQNGNKNRKKEKPRPYSLDALESTALEDPSEEDLRRAFADEVYRRKHVPKNFVETDFISDIEDNDEDGDGNNDEGLIPLEDPEMCPIQDEFEENGQIENSSDEGDWNGSDDAFTDKEDESYGGGEGNENENDDQRLDFSKGGVKIPLFDNHANTKKAEYVGTHRSIYDHPTTKTSSQRVETMPARTKSLVADALTDSLSTKKLALSRHLERLAELEEEATDMSPWRYICRLLGQVAIAPLAYRFNRQSLLLRRTEDDITGINQYAKAIASGVSVSWTSAFIRSLFLAAILFYGICGALMGIPLETEPSLYFALGPIATAGTALVGLLLGTDISSLNLISSLLSSTLFNAGTREKVLISRKYSATIYFSLLIALCVTAVGIISDTALISSIAHGATSSTNTPSFLSSSFSLFPLLGQENKTPFLSTSPIYHRSVFISASVTSSLVGDMSPAAISDRSIIEKSLEPTDLEDEAVGSLFSALHQGYSPILGIMWIGSACLVHSLIAIGVALLACYAFTIKARFRSASRAISGTIPFGWDGNENEEKSNADGDGNNDIQIPTTGTNAEDIDDDLQAQRKIEREENTLRKEALTSVATASHTLRRLVDASVVMDFFQTHFGPYAGLLVILSLVRFGAQVALALRSSQSRFIADLWAQKSFFGSGILQPMLVCLLVLGPLSKLAVETEFLRKVAARFLHTRAVVEAAVEREKIQGEVRHRHNDHEHEYKHHHNAVSNFAGEKNQTVLGGMFDRKILSFTSKFLKQAELTPQVLGVKLHGTSTAEFISSLLFFYLTLLKYKYKQLL